MISLNLSQVKALGFDFDAAVQAFIDELMAHRFTVDVPMPTPPHPLIEAAVQRMPQGDGQPDTFVRDYLILDDTPPPPTLEERKAALTIQVHAAAGDLIETILPHRKVGLWRMDLSRVPLDETNKPQPSGYHLAITARFKAAEEIRYVAALAVAALDDLSEAGIAAWQPPSWPDVAGLTEPPRK